MADLGSVVCLHECVNAHAHHKETKPNHKLLRQVLECAVFIQAHVLELQERFCHFYCSEYFSGCLFSKISCCMDSNLKLLTARKKAIRHTHC